MDPSTGDLYGPLPTPAERQAGDELTAAELEELERQLDQKDGEMAAMAAEANRALEHLRAGGRLVAVDEPVVQRLRLGDRELRRRRRRR